MLTFLEPSFFYNRRTYGGSGQNRLDYKQFRGSGRPDTSPPIKRMRRDW